MRCVAVGALVLSLTALSACSRPSTNAADYVGEYIFTPGQEAGADCPSGADCADVVILRADGVALEIRRSSTPPGISTTEKPWKVDLVLPDHPAIDIGDFSAPVEVLGKRVRLGLNDDLNEYYEKVR